MRVTMWTKINYWERSFLREQQSVQLLLSHLSSTANFIVVFNPPKFPPTSIILNERDQFGIKNKKERSWSDLANEEKFGNWWKRNKKRHAIGHYVTHVTRNTLTRGRKESVGHRSVCYARGIISFSSSPWEEEKWRRTMSGGNSCDSPGHAIEPVLLSSNLWSLYHRTQLRRISIPLLYLSLQSFDQNFLKYNSFNCAGNSKEPSKTLLSKFPSFRAQIGHLFHPSTISSFPICHARCVVSFSSPIATLLDRRAGHERRRSSLEEEKGDSGKRDEMWSVGTRRKERHVLNESLAGTCSVPKKGRKGRKGRVRKDEVKCNRKHARYLGRVWFFHTGFLPWLLYKQELSD